VLQMTGASNGPVVQAWRALTAIHDFNRRETRRRSKKLDLLLTLVSEGHEPVDLRANGSAGFTRGHGRLGTCVFTCRAICEDAETWFVGADEQPAPQWIEGQVLISSNPPS
jgi:hypothetical protein